MKKLLLSILVAAASWASASTVSLSSSPNGPSVYGFDHQALTPNGGLIRIGYLATAGDPNSFVEYGTSTIKNAGPAAAPQPSKVVGSVLNDGPAGNEESDDAAFNNKDIYVWIYNAPTAGAATQRGLFHAVGFQFPVDDPAGIGDAIAVTATSLTEYITDPKLSPQGGVDMAAAANANGSGLGRLFLGNLVPEPSSMGLLALAGLVLARRRR